MAACLFAWLGTAPERIAWQMAAGVRAAVNSGLHRLIVGRTMRIWTRRAGYFGRLSKNMATRFRGQICLYSWAMSHLNPWGLRHLVLGEVARIRGSRKSCIGAQKEPGWVMNVTVGSASCKPLWVLCKWV